MASWQEISLSLWQDKITTAVAVGGNGVPLVWLHGPWGLDADHAFLDRLAERHKVYAPRHPGTTPGDSEAVHQLDDGWDLVVYHGELFDRLGLEAPVVAGHSFGGMVGAEIAAAVPSRVSRLVLIDPVGLWREDLPVRNWMLLPETERARALFADPAGAAAQRFFAVPETQPARAEAIASVIWAQACTGKFVWPIPDKGLKKRIHCIAAPTLVVWGRDDRIIAAPYAEEFSRNLANSKVALIDRAGHFPHLEQADAVVRALTDFVGR